MAIFTLSSAWQKVAASGSKVVVENTSAKAQVLIATSAGAPVTSDGIALPPGEPLILTLTADLYAHTVSPSATVEVMSGIS